VINSSKIFLIFIAVSHYFLLSTLYLDYNELAQFSDYHHKTEVNRKDNLITISSNFPFQFSINGKNDISTINLMKTEYKKFLFRFPQIKVKKQNKLLFSNQQYVYDIGYFYQKEKKSNLIYPFHFFM